MAGGFKVVGNEAKRHRLDGEVADLAPFAMDAEMEHAFAALDVFHFELAELFAAQAMVEQGSEDRAVALSFKRVWRWRIEESPRLVVGECRCRAFVHVCCGALHAVNRIVGDGVLFAEVVEQGRECRELPADRGW